MDAPLVSAAKPPTGRKMKARAPPPPGKPATPNVHSGQNTPRGVSPVRQQSPLHMKEDPPDSAVEVTVVLPSGLETRSVVSGSHAMMDLLVELCLQNHLNPSHHALEIWSSETQQPLSFKPNTLVGALNVRTVFLKEKVPEEKAKPGPPKAPEKSVRLVVNYLRTQKAVVRVSPEVPLQNILPVICAKCDVSPEHVVLLRDNVGGEELELSKSLSELGIQELYAWDNKRETFRKSSLGNDETDKEKKKFLGFFKVNKRSNSKVEQPRLSGVDGDEDASKLVPGRGSNGCLTTPSSPSVNSRSITLGPSLSLSNISGMSVRSDMKKRRAPPPPPLPGAGPPAQDKVSEKVSLGSQMDLQKKKRRAPAPPPPQPPPPSPQMPMRTEDREENRKSATGVGRQVPQKPPRGTARGPPQLVLPPPPPYPPPDTDGAPGEGAASEASSLRPTLSLPLGPGSPGGMDAAPPVPSEAEETVSVGSCFASEDTAEDSGVMSSPSDVISLDSQHDSTKSKDKWATDQEDLSDQDLAGTPELGPQKGPSWERNGSGTWHSRTEKAATASHGDKDLFVTGRFQQTLVDLDGELEEMEESYDTDSSSLTGSVNGVSSPCAQDAVIADSDADVVPVTFIGEVLDDPVESALFSSTYDHAGSFDSGSAASRPAHLPPALAGPSQQHGRKRAQVPDAPSPPHDAGGEVRRALPNACKDVTLITVAPRATSASEPHRQDLNAKDRGREQGPAPNGSTRAIKRVTSPPVREKGGDDKKDVSASLSWYQRGQNPGGSFGLKYGLTTYKIVPPKSEMRCYDRGVSLSTGAIKIDELGNLVSPHVNGGRTIALPSAALEKETQPLGKIKEFQRSDSVTKHLGHPMGCLATRPPTPTPTTPAKLLHHERRPGAEPAFPDPKVTSPQQQSTHPDDGRHLGKGESRPPAAATCHVKVPAASPAPVPFLKPQRRTSSQYVASAIAKRIGPPGAHAHVARKHAGAEGTPAGRGPQLSGPPPAAKDAASPGPRPEPHLGAAEAKSPCGHLPDSNGEESAAGTHTRTQARGLPGKLSAPDCPAGIHRRSHVPPVMASHRDRVSAGQSCGFSGKQSTGDHRTSSASDPTCTPDSTNAPPTLSGGDHTPGRALVNGSRGLPICSEPPHSPKASGMKSHAVLEQEEKPSVSRTDLHDTDGTLPPSIFGPKKKFRPVVQRPVPKDTSLHSALMEAIHSAGGKDRLRKTAEHSPEGGPKKPSYTEAESEHSALLAAIRGHRGACSLRKVASSASEELRGFRDAARSAHASGLPGLEDPGSQPPPALPPPSPPAAPAPSASTTASRPSSGPLGTPVDARQALMDAIRSGTGAARLRKVPLLV